MRHLIILSILALAFAACSSENPETKQQLKQNGFSEQSASDLSKMQLTKEETGGLVQAKKSGMNEVALQEMVKSMHDRDLKFTIGPETQLLVQEGMSPTAVTQLVEMQAIPRWTDDIGALK